MTRPVLDTIRAVLKFKDHATITEVGRFADMKPRQVLDVIGLRRTRCGSNLIGLFDATQSAPYAFQKNHLRIESG